MKESYDVTLTDEQWSLLPMLITTVLNGQSISINMHQRLLAEDAINAIKHSQEKNCPIC